MEYNGSQTSLKRYEISERHLITPIDSALRAVQRR